MNTRSHSRLWMSAIALLLVVGQGCSSHSVGYTVDSERGPDGTMSDGTAMMEESGDTMPSNGDYQTGRSFYESGESYDPGAIGYSPAYNHNGQIPDGKEIKNGAYSYQGYDPQYDQEYDPGYDRGYQPGPGADYKHNYSGVPGYDSNNGPVSGFGSGFAEGVNPTPEAWAEAFLRGNVAEGPSEDGSPQGGLMSEHVDQDVFVARSNPYASEYGSGNQSRESHSASSMNGQYGSYESSWGGNVEDVYFAFDSWKISHEGAKSLQADAEWLKNHPGHQVTIEGHCDQRGTQDYNMVLGKKRAEAAKEYLVDLGVNSSQLKVVSYGKERPFCSEHNEFCYQQNRRGHIDLQN